MSLKVGFQAENLAELAPERLLRTPKVHLGEDVVLLAEPLRPRRGGGGCAQRPCGTRCATGATPEPTRVVLTHPGELAEAEARRIASRGF